MERRVCAGERVPLMEMVEIRESVLSPTLRDVGVTLALAVRKGETEPAGEGEGRTPVAVTLGETVESPASLGEAKSEVLGVGVGSVVKLAEPVPAAFPKREGEKGGEEDGCAGEAVASGVHDPLEEAVAPSNTSAGRDGEAPEVGVLPPPPSPPATALP